MWCWQNPFILKVDRLGASVSCQLQPACSWQGQANSITSSGLAACFLKASKGESSHLNRCYIVMWCDYVDIITYILSSLLYWLEGSHTLLHKRGLYKGVSGFDLGIINWLQVTENAIYKIDIYFSFIEALSSGQQPRAGVAALLQADTGVLSSFQLHYS